MLKRTLTILLLTSTILWISCDDLGKILQDQSLTEGEIVEGLKEALEIGLGNSVTTASAAGGYLENELIKVLLPEEVVELKDAIENESVRILSVNVPLSTLYSAYLLTLPESQGDLFENLRIAMNRGAEQAASKAVPIFRNALLNMSFTDALAILKGGETAATDYFYATTHEDLYDAFQPEVRNALDQVEANAIYETTSGFMNYRYEVTLLGITGGASAGDVLDIDLPETIDGYATEKAIDGLFYLIGEEEKKIRQDPFGWASDIIEKVFGSTEALGG